MTEAELNEVRDLKRRIVELEKRLRSLTLSVEKLSPVLDGMPHARSPCSRVEFLATQIIETERELKNLREEMEVAAARLTCRLYKMPLTSREYSVVALRYVACMRFRDIQFELHMSDARMWFLHREALKKILDRSLEKQC